MHNIPLFCNCKRLQGICLNAINETWSLITRKVEEFDMAVHVIDEANRCLQCPNPRCRENGCPIHTNIPEMIRLFKENRMMEAAEMLFENNPLSMICSLVCNHGNQCERGTCSHFFY